MTGDTCLQKTEQKQKEKKQHSAVIPNTAVVCCKALYSVVWTSVTLSILFNTVSVALFIVLGMSNQATW